MENIDRLAIFAIIYFSIIALFLSCKENIPEIQSDCLEEPYPNMVCTMEVDYQCGCDGVLYINHCHATKNGVTKIRPYDIDEPGDNCNPW